MRRSAQPSQFGDQIAEELNVKNVSVADSASGIMSIKIEPNMKTLGPKMGRHTAAAKAAIEKLDGTEVSARVANREQVLVSIDGNPMPIDAEDLMVKRTFAEGWAGAADGKTVVLFDTKVTEELKNEGIARDIIRNVQNMRKTGAGYCRSHSSGRRPSQARDPRPSKCPIHCGKLGGEVGPARGWGGRWLRASWTSTTKDRRLTDERERWCEILSRPT
jgi:hypothetical protein